MKISLSLLLEVTSQLFTKQKPKRSTTKNIFVQNNGISFSQKKKRHHTETKDTASPTKIMELQKPEAYIICRTSPNHTSSPSGIYHSSLQRKTFPSSE